MRLAASLALVLAASLSGCIQVTPREAFEPAFEQSAAADVEMTGTYRSSGPGWVILYREQDNATAEPWYELSYTVSTAQSHGPHSIGLLGPLPVFRLSDGTLAPQMDWGFHTILRSPSGEPTTQQGWRAGLGSARGNPMAGAMVAVAADAPFTVDYEFGFAEGVGHNAFASRDFEGNGTSFHYAGGLPGHLATFKTLAVQLEEPGWSHFQILGGIGTSGPAFRATHVTFPSERRESHVEPYVPTYGSPPVSYMGVIKDTAGTFYGQSLVVEPRIDIELVLIHMPGVADALGHNWRTGSYHEYSPPVR